MYAYDEETGSILRSHAKKQLGAGWTEDATALLAIARHGTAEAVYISPADIHYAAKHDNMFEVVERFMGLLSIPRTFDTFADFALGWESGHFYNVLAAGRLAAAHKELNLPGAEQWYGDLGRATMRKARESNAWVYSVADVYDWLGIMGPATGVTVFNTCGGRNGQHVYGAHIWQRTAPPPRPSTVVCCDCGATQL